ncbi:MAG: bifunctional transaldolase/phosoglucose isomerase [Rhodospirillaceae bacterium]|nr:bifunctional transaldolase/phosoglucose isomerase [Rhodospirillaceae bacterium]
MNPLLALQDFGQSVWLDFVRRGLIASGELKRLVERDRIRGVTSNPAIFEKAIAGSHDYDEAFERLPAPAELEAQTIFETLALEDIRAAADVLRPVYDETDGRDGFISLEVSPYLALDTEGTIQEARRLWQAVGRDNLMIKVPATEAGIPAIRTLTGEGINVNVTLLFSIRRYEEVARAYIDGVRHFVEAGGDPHRLASVASFFISRIDTVVDKIIEERLTDRRLSANEREALKSLKGRVAIANAKLTYQLYKRLFADSGWGELAAKGARTQRLLWASTGTKNPEYPDTLYVDELIGPDTVNTMPVQTLDAFRDHGRPRATLEDGLDAARDRMETAERLGIAMEEVSERLVREGVKLFADAADKLLGAVERKRAALIGPALDRHAFRLPEPLQAKVDETLEDWRAGGKVRRLWARDASLWTENGEDGWMGWLDIAERQRARAADLALLGTAARGDGIRDVVVLGMGGSSLGPEVLARTYAPVAGYPRLHVLDSTDPSEVKARADGIDPARTLFIVASKSGSTLEPNLFRRYFHHRLAERVGDVVASGQFLAITDPGSPMEAEARAAHFRRIVHGEPQIGGRYSVLSAFGLVPAALMGVDVARWLDRTMAMVRACGASVPPADNPGVALGVVLGTLALAGRDKLTLVASPAVAHFGAWVEQLIAESTGKRGRGIIPVDLEPLGEPGVYGNDRVFVYLRLAAAPDAAQDAAVAALERAGQPVLRLELADTEGLGQEFFRWEVATAVAGAILGINPFDQPDVEAAKVAARALTAALERDGRLPEERPLHEEDGIALFTDEANARALRAGVKKPSLKAYLSAHLDRLQAGDYFATLAYLERNEANQAPLQGLRRAVRDGRRVATCLGFGPRYLHSTGQAYKGGPNSGVFLMLTRTPAADLPVPGQLLTFGQVQLAQALGDLRVLLERGRRAVRLHLSDDSPTAVERVRVLVESALR